MVVLVLVSLLLRELLLLLLHRYVHETHHHVDHLLLGVFVRPVSGRGVKRLACLDVVVHLLVGDLLLAGAFSIGIEDVLARLIWPRAQEIGEASSSGCDGSQSGRETKAPRRTPCSMVSSFFPFSLMSSKHMLLRS
jgi:hypothetical protein